MKAFLNFIRNEPAMVISLVLAGLNMVVTLNADQQLHVSTILESLIVLLGGAVIRQNVTPVAKLAGR